MRRFILVPTRVFGLSAAVTLGLLGALSRPARAAKTTDCLNQSTSVCQMVESCSGGFEPNGSCKYIYTVTRYYWKN